MSLGSNMPFWSRGILVLIGVCVLLEICCRWALAVCVVFSSTAATRLVRRNQPDSRIARDMQFCGSSLAWVRAISCMIESD